MSTTLVHAARAAQERSAGLRDRSAALLAAADALIAQFRPDPDADRRVAQLAEEVVGLRRAMESRAIIEQAKGVIVATAGCDPDAAFELLVRQSQHENRKLRELAAELVARNVRPR